TESRENVVYIDPAQLKDGDYTFNASIYMFSDDEIPDVLDGAFALWDGYDANCEMTRYIKFSNLSAANTLNDNVSDDYDLPGLNSDSCIEGTTTYFKYFPTCFSKIITLGGKNILKSSFSALVGKELLSYDLTPVYSAGPFKIKFKEAKTDIWHTYDLTWDEKTGIAKTTEPTYAGNTDPKILTIRNYDPDIPEGDILPDACNAIIAENLSNSKVSWFGGRSDAYPFVSFDVTIDDDTEEGVYYVGFRYNSSNGNNLSFIPSEKLDENGYFKDGQFYTMYHYPANLGAKDPSMYNGKKNLASADRINNQENWLKIIVGSPEEPQQETTGDVNNDGNVDISDATDVLRIYAESAASADSSELILKDASVNADVNGDGVVDIADATLILEMYAKNAAGMN
ncbi:MAG: dockerin type I repeat-containing protein, partial [Ruminococcus sp.]